MKKNNKNYYIFQIDINTLNIWNTILLIVLLIPSYILYPSFIMDTINNYSFLEFFIYYFIYMIIHEIIHSITYVLNGAKFSKITYGICLEKSVLCCLCKQDIKRKNIICSLLSPLIFIGIITYIISIIFKLPLLFTLSIFNIAGCIGDIIMFSFINKLDKNITFSEFDDPIGFSIASSTDISKNKYFGVNYITKTDNLERKNFKKIYISKPSIIIILIFIMFGIFLNT